MTLEDLKSLAPAVVIVIGWTISATIGWRKIHEKINGLGARTNALELTVGSHETMLDSHDTTIRDSANDRKALFEKVGELRSEISGLKKASEIRDTSTNLTLTEIKVELGKLGTKVDFLIEEKMK